MSSVICSNQQRRTHLHGGYLASRVLSSDRLRRRHVNNLSMNWKKNDQSNLPEAEAAKPLTGFSAAVHLTPQMYKNSSGDR